MPYKSPSWKPYERDLSKNNAFNIVEAAYKGKYGIAAICCYNLEGILASIRAAEVKRSPVIVQLFPWAIEYAGGVLLHAAAEAAHKATVPVAIHMDHCQTPEMVKMAADLGGFDGIMVDMSHYDKEENMRLSKELVAYCNERGIITECEPGRINGGEDGVADTADLEEVLTTPEQAEEFVALGINWLAPAFGNVHGNYGPKGPQLDFPRLESIEKKVGDRVKLVLHGAHEDHFDEPLFQRLIAAGVAKFNLNGSVNNEYTKIQAEMAGKIPLTEVIDKGTNAMQKVVEQHMDWMMSSGKAELP
jgi:fructose-bisphosphate aldolase class II